jgi:hypothetical protein
LGKRKKLNKKEKDWLRENYIEIELKEEEEGIEEIEEEQN